jgi:hypothetical protein
MLRRRHIHIMEIFSILLFSILANYLFEVKIDFNADLDWIRIAKIVLLTAGSFFLYLSVYTLREIEEESEKNYHHEQERKAEISIDTFFSENLIKFKKKITWKIVVALICTCLFFLIEPIVSYFQL